jgi:histidine triad (HIT) family protein
MSSIFSKIIAKEIPAYFVYEDDHVVAFLDISQATRGHTLVVPKVEYKDIFDMPGELAAHVFKVSVKVAKAIQKAFNAKGLNILSNNGETAGQTVFHFHLHLIPRYEKDDVTFRLSNYMGGLNGTDYKERANLIKEALL